MLRFGLVDSNNNLVQVISENIKQDEKDNFQEMIIEKILTNVQQILHDSGQNINSIEKIGVACPGTISNGIVVKAGNLGLYNYNLKGKLQEKLNKPINIENDGKCAAIAEKALGSLKEYDDCVFINLGTGVGGAVFLQGKLIKPCKYSGLEIGHITIEINGKQCTCGKKGCFEKYASMKALKDTIRHEYGLNGEVHSQELMQLLGNGSSLSNKILDEYLENLCIGIANLIDLFEPDAISIGGSFAYYEELFLEPLKKKLFSKNRTFNNRNDIILKTASLQNYAGILGAVFI